jgi:3-deoxy-D-manno-octulosonic-acid transferase
LPEVHGGLMRHCLPEFINENENYKCVIAPHEVTPENVNKLEKLLKKPSIRFSMATESNIHQYQVLIIDSIGLLSSVYRYGKFAYIGGGFGVGIHNILEAATFGLPVIFGPNYQKFREARDMVEIGAALPVNTYNELQNVISGLLNNSKMLDELSQKSRDYVHKNRGATQLILNQIFQ